MGRSYIYSQKQKNRLMNQNNFIIYSQFFFLQNKFIIYLFISKKLSDGSSGWVGLLPNLNQKAQIGNVLIQITGPIVPTIITG